MISTRTCDVCKKPIETMCFQDEDYCSDNCKKAKRRARKKRRW